MLDRHRRPSSAATVVLRLLVSPFLMSIPCQPLASTSPGRHLVLDFDGTCTIKDTTPLLPRIAAICAGDDAKARRTRLGSWQKLEEEYLRAYSEAKDALFSSDYDGDLHSALDALDTVSTTVTEQVSASGCLAGLPSLPEEMADLIARHDELRDATRLRPGCAAAVARAHAAGWEPAVVSINWCPPLIEAALAVPVRRHAQGEEEILPMSRIWSNAVDERGVVRLSIPGASAKRSRIAQIVRESRASAGGSSTVIYLGDSSTDLSAMLEADIGILIGRSGTVQSFSKRWGVRLAGLGERRREGGGGGIPWVHDRDHDTVWIADEWYQVDELLEKVGKDIHREI